MLMGAGHKKMMREAIETHKQMVDAFEAHGTEIVTAAAKLITEAIRRGGRVYVCGNGGSAADAQHIAGELVGRFRRERRALPAVALSTDTSVLTSIANDYDYDNVFARQVEALVREDDVLWALSTSGRSANILRAAELAKERGASVLAFTGREGSELEDISDLCLCSPDESTARSQEIHQLAYHMICDLVEASCCQE